MKVKQERKMREMRCDSEREKEEEKPLFYFLCYLAKWVLIKEQCTPESSVAKFFSLK